MNYTGEHLLPGQLGHFLLVLSLVSSLLATVAYAFSTSTRDLIQAASWKRLARWAFLTETVAVFLIFGIIFYIISQHYHEYYYVWNHSDKSLEPKYLLSSIWEGQEGSFLLWSLWHSVLGMILMRTTKEWEAPVLAVVSFAQFCLATMILGIYFFGVKVGSNPFLLTRQNFQDLPVFNRADYLTLPRFQDGNGLNQLLQNYWMVIHPPILFLGFASTIVPFAYAIAGLWKRDFTGWTKAALPWALFAAAILGAGIMMGAKWAYESLNFGGYWAWDPVENSSLVPWLVLIAGIHTQVIFNATGQSLRTTYLFYILSFLLVLYSTYLTRSGDLQETSVHAFTDLGMNGQLRIFLFIFLVPSLTWYLIRYRHIPQISTEEQSWSREFWMFIGSVVLFLSALAIIIPTSFPIFNKLFQTNLAIGSDQEFAYNRIQVFIAIIIGVLTAIGQFLNYKLTAPAVFGRKILRSTLLALVVSLGVILFGNIHYDKYGYGFLVALYLALFAAIYAVAANTDYIIAALKGKMKAAGGSVTHIGFGLLLVGVIISSAKKEILSINRFNPVNFGSDNKEKGEENLTLFREVRSDMGDYWATYTGDSATHNGKFMYFRIRMERKDGQDAFDLYPDLIKNTKGQEGYSNNPDARHYLHKDIFAYISYSDKMLEGEDTTQYRSQVIGLRDTIFYSRGYVVLDTVGLNLPNDRVPFAVQDTAVVARLRVMSFSGDKSYTLNPYLYIRDNQVALMPDTLLGKSLAVRFSRITEDKKFEIGIKESSRLTPFVTLKVLSFPMINFVWLGTLIMVAGILMSLSRRIKLL